MFLKETKRKDSSGALYSYFRLCESYRDRQGFTQRRQVMALGRMEGFSSQDRMHFILLLDKRLRGDTDLFLSVERKEVQEYVNDIYTKLIALKKIDIPGKELSENGRISHQQEHEKRFIVKAASLKHEDAREIGAEHLCMQTIRFLKIDKALSGLGFTESEVSLAITQIAARAVHPASELATVQWIKERSDICRLSGYDASSLTKDQLYQSSLRLFDVNNELKSHLSRWTKELFGYDDSIILYDLTNTFLEGKMENSLVCTYGRSKEKRCDCKLIVLALVVNQFGFPKHYQLFEGNMSDANSLPLIIEDLDRQLKSLGIKPTIVMDAGIATEANLKLLRAKAYNYLCVSRSSQMAYLPKEKTERVEVQDNLKQSIELMQVTVPEDASGDHFLWVRSQAKAAKENGMKEQFTKRFEDELEKIKASLSKKQGVKKTNKVNERIGRAKQKYPSISSHYQITLIEDKKKEVVTELEWEVKQEYANNESAGVYFLRTNLNEMDEKSIWFIYNILKEVESSFRCLKTDLDLRPVYHKTDKACLAHLHLGILAYWVVVTIRYQLKEKGIHHNWKQIVEIMNTQKSVQSTMINLKDETVIIRKCSEPNQKVCQIYQAINISNLPYKMIKSVGYQIENQKINKVDYQEDDSG